MKIALLKCDTVSDEFMHINGDYDDMFRRVVAEVRPDAVLESFDVCSGEFPTHPNRFNGFMITGSKHSVYEDLEWIHQTENFLLKIYDIGLPVAGICLGHQLIAQALGGTVCKSGRGWGVGMKTVHVNHRHPWMEPFISDLNLLVSHQDQVEVLPPDTEVLGGNDHCPNSMILIGRRFLGIQSHPEFSKEYDRALLHARRERIGAEIVDLAEATLAQPLHSKDMMQWIMRFFDSFNSGEPLLDA